MKLHPYTWRSLGAALLIVAVMLLLALIGCGGGNKPDETTQPVDCKATPKACV